MEAQYNVDTQKDYKQQRSKMSDSSNRKIKHRSATLQTLPTHNTLYPASKLKRSNYSSYLSMGHLPINDRVINLKQVDNHIFIGTLKTASNYSLLKENNIRRILNLTSSEITINSSCGIRCMNQQISSDMENLLKAIPKCIPFINEADSSGANILICCRDGYTRASPVLMAYYILKYNQNYHSAYEQIKISVDIPDLEIKPNFETQLMQVHCILNVKNNFGLFKF